MARTPGSGAKRIYIVITTLVIIIIGLQFVQQPVQNLPAKAPIEAPKEVTQILQRACYDCHSNQTNLRWYDKTAPASWLVSADIEKGRAHPNLSNWGTLSNDDQQGLVWEMVNMVLTQKMPLTAYSLVHPQSQLSQHEVAVLQQYARQLSPAKYHDTAVINEAGREFEKFRQKPVATNSEPVATNGVKYIPDYQNWQVISTTNRFDNHSIRVVYGNDIIVRAIKEGHTNPLPEGSTIVKAVWNSIEEKNGDIIPGSFVNIQMMTKDSHRFRDSKGWGFAKFNGTKLKPYGASPVFNTTCFNCHKIAGDNDYVFNLPLQNRDLN